MIRRLRRRFDGKGMMIRRSVWTTMALAISAVLVSACGKPTDRYLGTWQDVRNPARTLVIQENGQEFLAKDVDDTPSAFACKDLGEISSPVTSSSARIIAYRRSSSKPMAIS